MKLELQNKRGGRVYMSEKRNQLVRFGPRNGCSVDRDTEQVFRDGRGGTRPYSVRPDLRIVRWE